MEAQIQNMKNKKKIIVLGLDGATFSVIKPLLEKDELPNFKKLIDEGASGELKSTIPPLSPTAWASFMTGMNPSNHGAFDFIIKQPGSYNVSFVNSNSIKAPTFWETLGKTGKKVIIQNLMGTYPAKPVNGCLITGFLTPPGREYTYPKELKNELENKFGEYPRPSGSSAPSGEEADYIEATFNNMEKRIKITNYLMENKPWDLFFVLFSGTDVLQHAFWNYYAEENEKNKKKKNFEIMKDAIPHFYKKFDDFLGELFKKIDDNTTIIILSDHGFSKLNKVIFMNNLLLDMNLLILKRRPITQLKKWCLKHHLNVKNLLKIMEKIGFRIKGAAIESGKEQQFINKLFLSRHDIDWTKTKAFSIGVGGHIYINLKERESQGTVTLDKYHEIRKFVIEMLQNIKDSKNGKNLIEKVYRKEEIYTGKYSNMAPDISILPSEGYFPLYKEHFISPSFLMDSPTPGAHTLYGIFMIKGKDIQKGTKIFDMNIWDVPAVILKIFDVNNSYMDGKVPPGIFL